MNKERLARIADINKQDIEFLRSKALDPEKDLKGKTACSLAGALRSVGISDYVAGNGPNSFRERLSEAAMWRLKLFERFDAGDKVSPSFVSMIAYRALLDALASGDDVVSQKIATLIGGRVDIENENDRPFDIAFGYTLKHIVLSDFEGASRWVEALELECSDTDNRNFSGYAKLFKAILFENHSDAEAAVLDVVSGHLAECLGSGLFSDTEDELLCVWGVALVKLARVNGLLLGPVEPLIPADLLE